MQEQRLLTGAACSSFSLATVVGDDGLIKAAEFCLRDIAAQCTMAAEMKQKCGLGRRASGLCSDLRGGNQLTSKGVKNRGTSRLSLGESHQLQLIRKHLPQYERHASHLVDIDTDDKCVQDRHLYFLMSSVDACWICRFIRARFRRIIDSCRPFPDPGQRTSASSAVE